MLKSWTIYAASLIAMIALSACDRAEPQPPSLLLITLDTTRADHIGCYGRAGAKTPAIDGLAAKGVRFADAFCQVPLTLPSHTSLLTGAYPASTGVRVNGQVFGHGLPTLAEILRERGYRTGAFVAALVLDSGFGLDRGFDTYDDQMGEQKAVERSGDKVTDAALAWLRTPSDKPFFAWVHYFDPHHPNVAPPGFQEGFPTAYDGEIAFVDSQVARLLKFLDESGRRETTLIVVAGDHGEAFGEHGEMSHGLFVYNTTMHVPLIFSWEAQVPSAKVLDAPTGLIDVFPTILELLGLEARPDAAGENLADEWGESAATQRVVYGESEYAHIGFGWAGLKSLTTGQWKFIDAPRSELYDRTQDPAEAVNLIDQHPDIAEQMRTKVRQIAASSKVAQPASAANAQVLAQLRSLGYISAGSAATTNDSGEQRRDPKDMIDAYNTYTHAVELQLEERYAELVPIMERLVQLSPESDDFHSTLGVAYLETGRAADAEKAFAAGLRNAPDNPRQLWRMADALYRQNKLDQAAAHLEAAIKLDPNLAAASAMLGDIFEKKGQLPQAIEHYKKAVAAEPDLARVHSRLGITYANLGRFAEAEPHLRRYVELEPNSPHALSTLGNVLLRLKRPAEAADLLQKALQQDPANGAAYMSLVDALQGAGKPKEAITALRQARAALPEAKRLTLRLAWILATTTHENLRRPQEALQLARDICESGDPAADELTVLAAAYAATGDFQQAGTQAQKAISLAQSQGNTTAAATAQTHLQQYQMGQPLRIP